MSRFFKVGIQFSLILFFLDKYHLLIYKPGVLVCFSLVSELTGTEGGGASDFHGPKWLEFYF